MATEIVENGAVDDIPEIAAARPHLRSGALRRLAKLSARLEGATETAQAAINVHQQIKQTYQDAFEQACEDASIIIPPGEFDVQIDWNTGDVGFRPRG